MHEHADKPGGCDIDKVSNESLLGPNFLFNSREQTCSRYFRDQALSRLYCWNRRRCRGLKGWGRLGEEPLDLALLLLAEFDRSPAAPAVGQHEPIANRHRRPAIGTGAED